VERTHRQLRARFADRLCRDHADCFADVHQRAAAEVAAVAGRAQTVARFAGQRRAHAHFVDAEAFDFLDRRFVEQRARFVQRFLRFRIDDVRHRDAAEDTVAQRFDDFTAFDQRLHRDAVRRAAIVLDHHQILRHVDQTTRQVTRVRGLQRRIGQTLTCTVGRDEVLQNVQAFAEVRGNRRLDDRAVRLRHQATHTGQLTNLPRNPARPSRPSCRSS
jgi:hypothetical protein